MKFGTCGETNFTHLTLQMRVGSKIDVDVGLHLPPLNVRKSQVMIT
jgi:hypothetical protein